VRISELSGKEIVNLQNGARMGTIGESDLVINERSGKIEYLIVPTGKVRFPFFSDRGHIEIPWNSIKKIGTELIIVDLEAKKTPMF